MTVVTPVEARFVDRSPLLPDRTWRRGVPVVATWFLSIVAVLSFLAAAVVAIEPRVAPVLTIIDAALFPAPANLAYAMFLTLVAVSVHARKRIGWWALVVLLGLQVLGNAIGALFS